MKPIKTPAYFFIALFTAALFITSCSKDKKLERTLFKKDGDWNIASATWEVESHTDTGIVITNGTSSNIGSFTFDKDGDGYCVYKINGESYSSTYKWRVISEQIYITNSGGFWSLFDEEELSYQGNETGKKQITLEGTHDFYDYSNYNDVYITATFSLERN